MRFIRVFPTENVYSSFDRKYDKRNKLNKCYMRIVLGDANAKLGKGENGDRNSNKHYTTNEIGQLLEMEIHKETWKSHDGRT